MRKVYRVLAAIIAAVVVIQAMLLAWFVAGLGRWLTHGRGGTLYKSILGSSDTWLPEGPGHSIHWFNETVVLPALAVALLAVALAMRSGAGRAAAIVGLAGLKAWSGWVAFDVPALGAVHELAAFALFAAAAHAAITKAPGDGATPGS
jgi:hypothetical protein